MKQVRQRFLLGLGICLLLLLSLGFLSEHSVKTAEELLPTIQRDLDLNTPLQLLGEYESEAEPKAKLFCLRTTDNGTEHYYTVQVEKGLFHYDLRRISLTERGGESGIYTAHWGNGVFLLSANPQTATLKLTAQGTDTLIPISEVPFTYYWDISGIQTYSYGFYDQSGAVVWE